jgi:transposase
MKANLIGFGLQRRWWPFLTLPSSREAAGLPCEGVRSLSRRLREGQTSGHHTDAFGPTCSASKAQPPNQRPLVVVSVHWSLRCALHHGETRLCISLPFSISFIANIARKRPELNRDKTRLIGRTKGGMNTKLHAVTDTIGRPVLFFMTAGQVSDYTGARALGASLPAADWLSGDRGYDADWFHEALVGMGITPCIPGRKSRDKPVKYAKRRYKRRIRIEILFGRLKEWRRIATRYDRCPKVFLSAIALAATILFWL